MLECIVDSREQKLWEDLQDKLTVHLQTKMLALGDVLVQTDKGEILLMIERKSVRDLVQSLRDGRYHNQRKRWEEFRRNSPNTCVSLWLEGDLLSADMEENMKSSLLNALFRLQTKHNTIVHQVRTRDAFVRSLQMVVQKMEKEPHHLLPKPEENVPMVDLGRYKKSAHTEEEHWQNCLALVPGVSPQTASKINSHFPSLSSFMRDLETVPEDALHRLAAIPLHEKRRLGEKQAVKIIRHFHPSCLDRKTKE